jgi:Rieske Fe-S protein
MSESSPEKKSESVESASPVARKVSRRQWLTIWGVGLNAIACALFAIPIIGYVLAPGARREMKKDLSWVTLGELTKYPVGETRFATYRNPSVVSWDGDTGNVACWVRRVSNDQWQVFAVNCAHLGCPVRWFPQSGLFMCPCHGGAYYADGSRASGPPPRGLFQYDYKIENGRLWIKAGQMPTLASPPSVASAGQSKGCSCA